MQYEQSMILSLILGRLKQPICLYATSFMLAVVYIKIWFMLENLEEIHQLAKRQKEGRYQEFVIIDYDLTVQDQNN